MVIPRKLDDQNYEDIVREAVDRLPWLCPDWTDHNAHDPGITILELMAWYKEMQQYQMDVLTPALQRGLLTLSGVETLDPAAAVCTLQLPPEAGERPALARLRSPQGLPFELTEAFSQQTCLLSRAAVVQQERVTDVTDLLTGSVELQPFCFGGQSGSSLRLGFSGQPQQELRLWFEVIPPTGAVRSPFAENQAPPREIAFAAAEQQLSVTDDTHALSQSGYIRMTVPHGWQPEQDGLYWLTLTLVRAGCEEQPRLRLISDRRCQAVQQQTCARSHWVTVQGQAEVVLTDAHARTAEPAVLIRTQQGWKQLTEFQSRQTSDGRSFLFDASQAVQDGAGNALIVCVDTAAGKFLFDTTGRPGEQLFLDLDGQTILPQSFRLLCDTRCPDGEIRPTIWQPVEELFTCGPRDRVFTYDPVHQLIGFGNGQYGAIPAAGFGTVLVADLVVSRCGDGNIPADAGLCFVEDGMSVGNAAADGGSDAESLREARERLLRRLSRTEKCLSAADYEEQARRTPGLRVAAAKALAGYDPQAPTGTRQAATVTVVVLPASDARCPMPDERFLAAVSRQLDRRRTIGIRTQAIAPQYIAVSVRAQLRTAAAMDRQTVLQALDEYLSAQRAQIGVPVRQSDVMALLQQLPDVLEIMQLELYSSSARAYRTTAGDIRIPPDAIAVLRQADIELIRI